MSTRLRLRRRCVIVSGSARSGTSWIAKTLSYAPGFTYYREPDNFYAVPGAEERFAWAYFTPDQDDAAYHDLMSRACRGEVATAFTMSDAPGPLVPLLGLRGIPLAERYPVLFFRKRHVLLKLVYANLNLAWLSARFPQTQQVCVIRHPCGQFESWRRLGWEPRPARLLENERLMAEHLHPFEGLLGGAEGFWERAGAYWGAHAYVTHRHTRDTVGPLLLLYEWLCGDPVARYRELYRRLRLTWSPKAERFLRLSDRESDGDPYSLTRPTRLQADGWKLRLSREDIESCRRFAEPFGLPYYPGFDTEAATGAPPGLSDS